MDATLTAAIETALGARVRSASPVSGGDVHVAARVGLADGRNVFVKHGGRAAPGLLEAEARGLAWLGAAGVVRVPRVLAVTAEPQALVLEWIEPGTPTRAGAEALGRGLAALHRFGAPCFGLDHDNWLAAIPQSNAQRPDWPTFYAEQRLVPLLARATDGGAATTRMRRGVEHVVRTIDERVGPSEPPSRLHGDLWGGNVIWDREGAPVLVDPAVYGGHREIDLAMMHLFGGFAPATFDAYAEAMPLAAGHRERVPLYQLLPLLVHCVLFGGSYVRAVERALDALSAER
jgi:fructosamine-3-kinase